MHSEQLGASLLARAVRVPAMANLRAELRLKRGTMLAIATSVGYTQETMSSMMLGNYPFYGANQLSPKIREAIQRAGYTVPPCLL